VYVDLNLVKINIAYCCERAYGSAAVAGMKSYIANLSSFLASKSAKRVGKL